MNEDTKTTITEVAAIVGIIIAIIGLALLLPGCNGVTPPLPPLNPTCAQWQAAISLMPDGQAKVEALALFLEKWPGGCPAPEPTPTPGTPAPGPTPAPTPTPSPTPAPRCLPDQAKWVVAPDQTGSLTAQVEAAIATYQQENPAEFTDGGTRLANRTAAGVAHFYDGLAMVLARSGLCAGQVYNDSSRGDMFGAQRPLVLPAAGHVEDFHIVEYGGFRLQRPLKVNSVWAPPAGPQPSPTPPEAPPPQATACPAPLPGDPLGPCGLNDIAIKIHTGHTFSRGGDCNLPDRVTLKVVDSTPHVRCYKDVPQPNYCAKIGSFAAPGVGNMICPLRLEGNADRAACELYALRARGSTTDGIWNWHSTACVLKTENPAQVSCWPSGCAVWVCNTDDSVCSERITP
jgi:hypothetical protein